MSARCRTNWIRPSRCPRRSHSAAVSDIVEEVWFEVIAAGRIGVRALLASVASPQVAAIGDGIGISLASLRRFWVVAARWNLSRVSFGPRNRSRMVVRAAVRSSESGRLERRGRSAAPSRSVGSTWPIWRHRGPRIRSRLRTAVSPRRASPRQDRRRQRANPVFRAKRQHAGAAAKIEYCAAPLRQINCKSRNPRPSHSQCRKIEPHPDRCYGHRCAGWYQRTGTPK